MKRLDRLNDASSKGDADASYELAMLYMAGIEGVEKDEEKGFKLFVLAGHKEHPVALCRLGSCWFRGVGVPKRDKVGLVATLTPHAVILA